MIALVVIGAIVALVVILLFLPLTMDLAYEGDLFIKLKYLGITVFDDQKSEKKKQKKQKDGKKQDKQPEDDNFLKRSYKQRGLLGTIKFCCSVLKIVIENIPAIVKHFKFRKLRVDLTVAGEDAADTAIKYGEVCAVVYPVVALLQSLIDLKPQQINVSVDFDKTESEFKGTVLARASVICWIIIIF